MWKKNNSHLKKIRTKPIVLGASLLAVVGVGLGITYAWFTASDKVANAFEGTQLVAEIDEVFIPNEQFKPGEKTTKEIRVHNTGETPAFVRLSLYEFFLSLQIDVTDQIGNANLKTVKQEVEPTVDQKNTDTWAPAATAHGTLEQKRINYVADKAIISDPKKKIGMYEYASSARKQTPLKFLTLNFSSAFKSKAPSVVAKNWIYENGYFYYLVPLQPGAESEPLMDSVSLSDATPNKYKGALYTLKVYMDAHDQTKPLADDWNLEKAGAVYSLLNPQLK